MPPGDPDALAGMIRELLGDEARLAELAAAGHRRFKRDYGEVALARTLSGYIDELGRARLTERASCRREQARAGVRKYMLELPNGTMTRYVAAAITPGLGWISRPLRAVRSSMESH